jgi:arylsulfatase A-like enzyme
MKADVYDGGHRVPFLARWPGRVPAGSVREDPACLTDILATAAEIAGDRLGEDAGEDSFSLMPALLGKGKLGRDHVVHHSAQGVFSIRRGKWKLNFGRGSGGFSKPARIEPKPGEPAGELYDLQKDPAESMNVYLENPQVVAELTQLLERVQRNRRSGPKV